MLVDKKNVSYSSFDEAIDEIDALTNFKYDLFNGFKDLDLDESEKRPLLKIINDRYEMEELAKEFYRALHKYDSLDESVEEEVLTNSLGDPIKVIHVNSIDEINKYEPISMNETKWKKFSRDWYSRLDAWDVDGLTNEEVYQGYVDLVNKIRRDYSLNPKLVYLEGKSYDELTDQLEVENILVKLEDAEDKYDSVPEVCYELPNGKRYTLIYNPLLLS